MLDSSTRNQRRHCREPSRRPARLPAAGPLALLLALILGTGPALAQVQDPAEDPGAGFRIGPGDVLSIDVFGLEELDRKVRVGRNGTISLPLLGSLEVGGLTLEQAEARLESLLEERQLLRDPDVSIFVEEMVSQTVYVQGAVRNPGVYQMMGPSTVLDMLGKAGGLSTREGERAGQEILVLRSTADGGQDRYRIDAERLIDQADPEANMVLRPGDIVMVPPVRTYRVYVTGAVRQPGPVEFLSTEGITVLQAVTAAGGPTERARMRSVHILRQRPDGTQERIKVNLKRVRSGKEQDVFLERNDTVVVGEWVF